MDIASQINAGASQSTEILIYRKCLCAYTKVICVESREVSHLNRDIT